MTVPASPMTCRSRKATVYGVVCPETQQVVLLYYLGPSTAVASAQLKHSPVSDPLQRNLVISFCSPNLGEFFCFPILVSEVCFCGMMLQKPTRQLWLPLLLCLPGLPSLKFTLLLCSWGKVRMKEDTVIAYVNDACTLVIQARPSSVDRFFRFLAVCD